MSGGTTGNQERNIMIMFLSNLHGDWVDKANRKFGWSSKERPYVIYNQKTVECRETNEAPLKDILEYLKTDEVEHRYLDAVFCFATNRVRNCDKEGNQQRAITVIKVKNKDEQDELDGMEWTSASDEEFFWEKRAQNITGLIFRKAEKIEDIKAVPENTVWRISVPFNEVKGGPVNSAIKAVTAMETAIKAYLKHEGVPITKCNIYADTTGGFRPANMAMSAVMQLLGYQEAKLRRVVYSDGKHVSNVQPIDDMYRLVAGVDAFTKYGSSAALDEYFADVKKDCPPLRELLDAMNAFSESVLLCQPDDIVTNLERLVPRLENFETEIGKETTLPEKVALFDRMVEELKGIYLPMYPNAKKVGEVRKENRLEIIKWCVDNTLLQQAVTFCTEWLPEHFVNHGVIFTEDDAIQMYCNEAMTTYRPGKKNLVMEFCATNRKWDAVFRPTISQAVSDLVAGNKSAAQIKEEMPSEYEKFIGRINSFLKRMPDDLDSIRHDLPTDNERLVRMTQNVKKNKQKIPYTAVTKQDILDRMVNWAFEATYHFGYPHLEKYNYHDVQLVDKEDDKEYKIINTTNVTREMLRCGMLKTEFRDAEKAVDFVKRYKEVQTKLRNKICHASEEEEEASKGEETITIASVQNKLKDFLEDIDRIESFKDARKPKYTGKWKLKKVKEATS